MLHRIFRYAKPDDNFETVFISEWRSLRWSIAQDCSCPPNNQCFSVFSRIPPDRHQEASFPGFCSWKRNMKCRKDKYRIYDGKAHAIRWNRMQRKVVPAITLPRNWPRGISGLFAWRTGFTSTLLHRCRLAAFNLPCLVTGVKSWYRVFQANHRLVLVSSNHRQISGFLCRIDVTDFHNDHLLNLKIYLSIHASQNLFSSWRSGAFGIKVISFTLWFNICIGIHLTYVSRFSAGGQRLFIFCDHQLVFLSAA